jgi:O-antigen/teichoic acid export membrane protein
MSSTRNALMWSSTGKMFGFLVAFATSVIIARFFLGPEEVGLFSIAFAATSLMAVLQEFGINRYIVGEAELDDEKLRTAFSVSLLVGWSVASLIIIAAWPISLLYGDPKLLPLMLVIGAAYFLVPLATVPMATLHRRMDFQSDFIVDLSMSLTNAVISLTLAAMGWSAMALACGALGQQIARVVASQWRAGWMFPYPLRIKNAKPVMRFGLGSTFLLIFDSTAARAPDLIVGGAIGSYAVGIYSRAGGLAVQIIILLTGAINSVFYPALARLRDEGKPLGEHYIRIVAGYTGLVFPAMAGLAVAAEPLVLALYGERWVEVAPILSILAIAQMLIVALPMPVQIPILLGHLSGVVIRSGISMVVVLIAFIVGAHWGIKGAAIAYVGYAIFNSLIFGLFMYQLIGFSRRALLQAYGHSLLPAIAAVAPLLIAYRYWVPANDMSFPQLFILVSAGILSWLCVLYIVRHPLRSELEKIIGDFHHRFLARAS